MNPSLLAYCAMAIGAAAIIGAGLNNLVTAGALFLFLNPLVNIEVDFGVSGRSISYDKLAILALALVFAWHVLNNRKHYLFKRKPTFCCIWLIYIAWSFTAAWWSGAPLKEQFWGLAEIIAYFIIFLVFLEICAGESSRTRMLKALLYGGVIMLAAVLLQNLAYLMTWKLLGPHYSFRAELLYSPFPRTFYDPRPGPIGHPNFLAAYLVLWAALYPLLFQIRSRVAGLTILAAHLLTLASTGSYGGFLAFAISCAMVLYFTPPLSENMVSGRISRSGARLLRHALAGFLILSIGTLAANDAGFMDLSLLPRIYIHRVGRKMLAERPLAGYGNGLFPQAFQQNERKYINAEGLKAPSWRKEGIGSMRTSQPRGRNKKFRRGSDDQLPSISAHSSYLKTFVESGVPGGLLYLFLLAGGLMEVFLHLRKTGRLSIRAPETWGWAACIGVCFQAGTENIFSSPKISVLYWAITAYCLTAKSERTKSS